MVKAICYIDWDWAKDWKSPHWLNGRIEENEVVKTNYFKEMSKPKYIHNNEMSIFLKKLN